MYATETSQYNVKKKNCHIPLWPNPRNYTVEIISTEKKKQQLSDFSRPHLTMLIC